MILASIIVIIIIIVGSYVEETVDNSWDNTDMMSEYIPVCRHHYFVALIALKCIMIVINNNVIVNLTMSTVFTVFSINYDSVNGHVC